MNSDFFKQLDAAFNDPATSRRDALRKAGRLGGAAALAVTPLYAMATDVTKSKRSLSRAYGFQSRDVLNFALTLEHLEYYFYRRAVGYTFQNEDGDDVTVAPELAFFEDDSPTKTLFETIRDHEEAHVSLLRTTITVEFGNPDIYEEDDFDYSVAGLDPFSSFEDFLILSQGFEDTGVRAYKGQAGALQGTQFLTTALQIHSVEARHAAAVRRVRGNVIGEDIEGWIPFAQPGAPAEIAAAYGPGVEFPSEANTTQAGVDLVAALGGTYTEEQITAAFDEALEMQPVLDIADPFITGEPND
jgi:rubrerythrin